MMIRAPIIFVNNFGFWCFHESRLTLFRISYRSLRPSHAPFSFYSFIYVDEFKFVLTTNIAYGTCLIHTYRYMYNCILYINHGARMFKFISIWFSFDTPSLSIHRFISFSVSDFCFFSATQKDGVTDQKF